MNEPYYRWQGFGAYHDGAGTWHILVIDDSGGRLFADGIISQHDAEWAAEVLNAALATWKAKDGTANRR